jgi:hypothetical protein
MGEILATRCLAACVLFLGTGNAALGQTADKGKLRAAVELPGIAALNGTKQADSGE